jgi:hypothetical protein
MNSFWWPGLSIINTASIFWYMMVTFSSFKIYCNTYFPNCLGYTWSHNWVLVELSIALFLKSLTLPNLYASILSKLLIVLIGYSRFCVAYYTKTLYECTKRQLNNVHHTWYVVPQCRPLNSRGFKHWLQLMSHWVIWGSIISCNSQYTAVGKLKTINNVLQMYHKSCPSMLALTYNEYRDYPKETE